MAFDPTKHLIRVQGSREYLPVAWRLVWFREVHPDWGISTHPEILDTERQVAVFRATILNAEGRVMAQATKMETAKGFPDYTEKAETGSIGRALALCGFGTQFAPEFEEGDRLADTPQGGNGPSEKPAAPKAAPTPAAKGRPAGCTCPPACKTHQPNNPGCALNQKAGAAPAQAAPKVAPANPPPPATQKAAPAQKTEADPVMCKQCGKVALPADFVAHCEATDTPLLCDNCITEYEPGATE